MQYDVQTPQEYLEALADDWRRPKLLELRSLLQRHGSDLTEEIHYKMLTYSDEQGIVIGLNAQKHYVSLYVGDTSKVDTDGSLLKGLNVGKGCIRFTRSVSISATRIEEFIQRVMQLRRLGVDLDC